MNPFVASIQRGLGLAVGQLLEEGAYGDLIQLRDQTLCAHRENYLIY
jgi:hypothetical protein